MIAPRLAIALALAASVTACDGRDPPLSRAHSAPAPATGAYRAARVASGLAEPVDLTAPAGDTTRVFIVEKGGTIRIIRDGALLERPFLDVSSRVSRGGEQGLLGLAFHPAYASNGRFYICFTDRTGDSRIVEYLVSTSPDSASATEREILFVDQPYSNHNGGQIAFGPDGYLYIGLGDGGGAGDPDGNGQNLDTLLGSILRIDVDAAGAPYAIPPGNPFVERPGARPEIWSFGLRNPWRFAFDRATGDLMIADVGQNAWEEIDFEPAGTGGRNYGWDRMEGRHCYPSGAACDTTGITMPIAEYDHGAGCSVTGGRIYRGAALPELNGAYFYGDYCTGLVRSLRVAGGLATDERDWTATLRTASGDAMRGLSSFGEDARGEIYLLLLSGDIYRIERGP